MADSNQYQIKQYSLTYALLYMQETRGRNALINTGQISYLFNLLLLCCATVCNNLHKFIFRHTSVCLCKLNGRSYVTDFPTFCILI